MAKTKTAKKRNKIYRWLAPGFFLSAVLEVYNRLEAEGLKPGSSRTWGNFRSDELYRMVRESWQGMTGLDHYYFPLTKEMVVELFENHRKACVNKKTKGSDTTTLQKLIKHFDGQALC